MSPLGQESSSSKDPMDILRKLPNVQNIQQPDTMFSFDGAWLPSTDAALIGPTNFQKLIIN